MTEQEARELREENVRLRRRLELLEKDNRFQERPPPKGEREQPIPHAKETRGDTMPSTQEGDALYQMVKKRLLHELPKEPVLLRVLVQQPELEVEVKRHTIVADGSTWVGIAGRLLKEGFFAEPKTSSALHGEASRRGISGIPARAYEACEKLTAMGFLTSEGKGIGYKAVPGMKVNIVEAR